MIYKLRYDRINYLVFNIPPDEIEEKLGDLFILDEPVWSDFWKPLNGQFYDDSDTKNVTTPPDITCWVTEHLILNEKAREALAEVIESYGELLPLKCEGIPYWMFHVTKLTGTEAIDEDKSERVIKESTFKDVKKLVFKEDAVKDLMLFKTDYNDYVNIYCNEAFKQMVEEAGLQGLVFNPDLASVF